MIKKAVLGTSAVLSFLLLTACDSTESSTKLTQPVQKPVQPNKQEQPSEVAAAELLPNAQYGDKLQMNEHEQQLQQFILSKMTGEHGVFTNYRDTNQSANVATGHEVLSESAGLMMRHYTLTGQQEAFDRTWARAKETFNLSSGFSYRYSPEQDKRYSLNAAVDDLRIVRALHEAGIVFKDGRYTEEANQYGKRFFEHNIKDGYLFDFYDETYSITNDFVTLCYIDLTSLGLLPVSQDQSQQLRSNMLHVIQKGYLSDEFPFYETRYSYKTQEYQSEHINIVESLLTILSLVEVQQHQQASIDYMKEHVKAGTLYGQYTKDGKPTNDIQSTAIYAIAAMIGSELGDEELYTDSIRRMNQFQVQSADSPFYGGFGDTGSMQTYSFDNLMALLAYSY